jgi:hypothetical protein
MFFLKRESRVREKGMQQGIIQNTKENIIEALELRFGKISSEIIDKINQTNDPAKLKELHKNAIQVKEIVTTHIVRLKLFRLKAEGVIRVQLPYFGGNIRFLHQTWPLNALFPNSLQPSAYPPK